MRPVEDLLKTSRQLNDFAVVVTAKGEIDLATAPEFRRAMRQACGIVAPPRHVVADLSGVRFLGSMGLQVLAETFDLCREHHTPLQVVATTRAVLRPLQLTGLDRILDVVPAQRGILRDAVG
jgi:anti-sigma B factor antagonist